MALAQLVARQLGRPSGRVGRLVGPILNRANRTINTDAVELLDVAPHHDALDVGFGGGVGLVELQRRAQHGFVAGLELSEEMVRQAERRFRREVAGGRMEIRRGKVEALPFDDGRFDRVVSVNTIYFWPDPAAAASELRRVLRPGGRVVLALRPKEQMEKLPTSRHGFRLFSETDLTELLKGAGFSETRVEVRNRSLFGMADVS